LILAAVALLFFAINWRQRLAHVTAMAIGAAILLVPWGVRNQIEMGQFTVTTTHGGYTFHLGNNREAYAAMFLPDWYSWQVSQQIQFSVDWDYLNVPRKQLGTFAPIPTGWVTPPSEAKRSQNLYDHGFDEIRAAPHLFAYSCFFRVYQLFSPSSRRCRGALRARATRSRSGIWPPMFC
jgi:hypothetical protein